MGDRKKYKKLRRKREWTLYNEWQEKERKKESWRDYNFCWIMRNYKKKQKKKTKTKKEWKKERKKDKINKNWSRKKERWRKKGEVIVYDEQ